MRSTILKLRDNLQNTFDEVKTKDDEILRLKEEAKESKKNFSVDIDEHKVSLLNTINSHLSAVGCATPSKANRVDSKKLKSEQLFKTVVDRIQNIKLASTDGREDFDTENALSILQEKNAELNNELRDMKEKQEKREKEFMLLSKQKDNLRAQLGSAVEMMSTKDNDLYPNKALDNDILPSLQYQLQTLQDDSKQSEITRDMTEQLIESFEVNERKINTLVEKLKEYKDKIRDQRSIIKSLKNSNPEVADTTELRAKLTTELKKQIREEEVAKRDKEIKRQRDLLASKSEEQSLYFQNKIEELEAKIEAKDNELTDYIIKVQENEAELEKLRQGKERRSVVSLEDQLDDLTRTPVKEDKSKNIDNQMRILEKVEKLDEKIIELGEKIGEYRVEVLDRIETELDEIQRSVTSSYINKSDYSKLSSKALEKLQKMKDTNTVIQVVRKCEVEGFSWLLLEKKDPLDKPLEIKNSNSFSKSSIENNPGGRTLFWVSEESLKADMLDYVYSFTPKFLLNSESLKLHIGDLFPDEDDKNGYKMLKESVRELQDKRNELLKQQREIKLGLRRENFLLEDAITTETEERLRELENKNIEYEDEIQSLLEENSEINIKNRELLEFINALNLRLKEMNALVYDFSRDRSHEEMFKTNADLITELDKVKNHKMMVDAELKKFKEAVEKRKIRTSRPDTKKEFDYPNSPASFDFEGDENEIFGESFVIDSSNKELEERLRNIEEELRQAKQDIESKDKNIIELKETIEELESVPKSASIDMRKSESFEMMNNDTIQNIKATLLQFLKNVPPTDKNNELLLSVIFDMLHMNAKELQDVKESRAKFASKDTPQKKKQSSKGGLFSKLLT